MNVYDFDNTIYKGESVFDFYMFCVKRRPYLIRYLFVILFAWGRYKLLLLSHEKLMLLAQKYAVTFIEEVKDIEDTVKKFWDKNQRKIKNFYLDSMREDDVIISASVDFLLKDICARLGIRRLICTQMDTKTGEIYRLCFRQQKPVLFKELFPEENIKNFYSDSMNDRPMMEIADNAFLVKGEKLIPVKADK